MAKKIATYQDILGLPENNVGEIIGGELIVSPRPAARHAHVASELNGDLIAPFSRGKGGPGGWWIIVEPELHFGADVLVPDLAGWRKERMPEVPDVPFFTLVPDWVCEIVSPSSARVDRVLKMPIYAREKVAHMWLIDPGLKTLDVFHLESGRWFLARSFAGDDVIRAEPFDEIGLEMKYWWPAQS